MADETAAKRWRIFIAIEVPEKVREAIAGAQKECIERMSEKCMKWARAEQFHLTLRFLGGVDPAALVELTSRLRQACANLRPLDLRCAGVGIFPERGRPRVLWVGVHDDAGSGLSQTFRGVAEASDGFGQEEPEKRFTGHVTLARCKDIDRPTATQARELVRQFSEREFGSWQATEVQLMRSELSARGAVHAVLERIHLGVKG
jgi:2'-5' RNA ligase